MRKNIEIDLREGDKRSLWFVLKKFRLREVGIQSKYGPRGLKARSYRGWLGCVRRGLRGELELGGAQERGKKKDKKREDNFEREEGRKRD